MNIMVLVSAWMTLLGVVCTVYGKNVSTRLVGLITLVIGFINFFLR